MVVIEFHGFGETNFSEIRPKLEAELKKFGLFDEVITKWLQPAEFKAYTTVVLGSSKSEPYVQVYYADALKIDDIIRAIAQAGVTALCQKIRVEEEISPERMRQIWQTKK